MALREYLTFQTLRLSAINLHYTPGPRVCCFKKLQCLIIDSLEEMLAGFDLRNKDQILVKTLVFLVA